MVARKGEKKSAAIKPLKIIMLHTDATDCRRSVSQQPATSPQRLVEQFSFEQLHSVMASNNGTALGLYDEMSTMYEQLDIYKHAGSRQDRYTLLKLYNGSSWARTFRKVSARVPHTAFNMSGFIQPALLLDLLERKTSMVSMTDNCLTVLQKLIQCMTSWPHLTLQ